MSRAQLLPSIITCSVKPSALSPASSGSCTLRAIYFCILTRSKLERSDPYARNSCRFVEGLQRIR